MEGGKSTTNTVKGVWKKLKVRGGADKLDLSEEREEKRRLLELEIFNKEGLHSSVKKLLAHNIHSLTLFIFTWPSTRAFDSFYDEGIFYRG